MMNSKLLIGIVSATGAVLVGLFIVWFLFFRPVPAAQTTTTEIGLGSGTTKSVGTSDSTDTTNTTQPVNSQASKQKVFKIADGPVTGATFIQTLYPTTTLARYILQENGHILDFPLDTPGALPRAASNTTIPGTARAVWGQQGNAAFMQYMDDGVIKTVSLLFSLATSSKSVTRPVQIQFFPNNIIDIASSPDGLQVVYLIPGSTGGVDGYTAKPDATGSKKLFSLALSEMLVLWPSQNTILLETKNNASAPGVIFSVDAKTGGIVPLIYSPGLTATADRSFTNIVYQSVGEDDARRTYVHNTKTNKDSALSFDPIPEKCVWSTVATSTMYCAVPLQYLPASYLDLWHLGVATGVDSIVSFEIGPINKTEYVADPGSADGGVASDILELAISQNDKYLLFVKKGDRSLWGVRLTQ